MSVGSIGAHIKLLREARGWSLADLSRLTEGIGKSHLSNIERGISDPSVTILCRIACAFGLGAGDLLVQAGYTVAPKSICTATIKVTMVGDTVLTEVIE